MKKSVLFLCLTLACSSTWADLILTEKGTSKYVIMLPDKADRYDNQSALDLQKYLKTISGVKIPVVSESKVSGNQAKISVGPTKIAKKAFTFAPGTGREEMIVKTMGQDLILFGGSRVGTAYAVYEFLEKICGCRWFDDLNRVIPQKSKLVIPEINIRRTPSFEYRAIHSSAANWNATDAETLMSMKATFHRVPNPVYGRPRNIHSFYDYCKDWPKDRLYLLAKGPNGRRQALRGYSGPNFCLSHPEAIDRFKKKLREYIAQDKEFCAKYKIPIPFLYNISQNDCSTYYCYCDKCQAIVKKHGESGLLLYFINQLANDVAKDHPHVQIQIAAYTFALKPPRGIKPAPNVVVEIMHTIGNYYTPVESDNTVKYRDYVKQWGDISARIGIWEYWNFFWDVYPAPYHNVHQIKKDLSFYHRNRARTMRIESHKADDSNFFTLKRWLGFKLLDDITLDDKKLIEDFMNGFYGPAAPEMKEYYNYLIERQKGANTSIFIPSKLHYKNPDRAWLDADFYRKAQDIFDRAEAKCKPGSMALKNVHRERIPVDLSLLYLYDKIKPAIARNVLAKRYFDYAEEHIKLRKKPSSWPAEILQIRNEYEKFMRADEIAALKNGPKPVWKIGSNWSTVKLNREMNGIPSKKQVTAQAKRDKNNLYFRFEEKGFTGKLKEGHQPYQGDDWEFFLAGKDKKQYLQFMIAPSGKYAVLWKKGSTEWITLRGAKVKSTVKGNDWKVEMTIPWASLPIKNICHGNFIRGIPKAGVAWSPTFSTSYVMPEVFGTIIWE